VFGETLIKPELISEVDLGPFKHKIDDGIPIRKSAYALINTLVEKMAEKVNIPAVLDIIVKGLEDTAEECMILCLFILSRIV
jgi:cullin-associated NEDD8-dissociated protein 1